MVTPFICIWCRLSLFLYLSSGNRQVVDEWIKPECTQKHQAAIKKLQRLRILLEDDGNKNFGKVKTKKC